MSKKVENLFLCNENKGLSKGVPFKWVQAGSGDSGGGKGDTVGE